MIHLSRFRIILLLVVAVATALAFPHLQDFIAMDQCLDRGGSYTYTHGQCVFGNEGELAWINPNRKLLQALAAALITGGLVVGVFAVLDYRRHQGRSHAT
jgi:hypothetical protein